MVFWREGERMNIAIVGSGGYIANHIVAMYRKCEYVESILCIDKSDEADVYLDLEEPEKFDYSVLDNVDYVIFTAAIPSPDICATEYDRCWRINVIGTKYFIEQTLKKQIKTLFLSSDAVFEGTPDKIYDEESETLAHAPYGKMKLTIENEFKYSNWFKVIRLSYVASARDSFITYCKNCMSNGEVAEVFHPFYRNCIVISDVAKVVEWMGRHWNEYEPFVLNVAGDELVSRVRIADELNRLYDGKLQYKIVSPNPAFFQNRQSITQMKSLYLHNYSILEAESFTEKIRRELDAAKNI